MELGNAYLAALRLPALLSPMADALADELDESVSLAVGDRDGIRFIHQATRRRAMSLSFRIGDLLPAERTAPGPLFASEWTDADWHAWRARRAADPADRGFPAVPPREIPCGEGEFEGKAERAGRDGWALDDQLIEPGLVAVSVPVRDPRTARIACVANVVSHTSRHTATDLRDALLPRLRATVADMERELAAVPQPDSGPPPANLVSWIGASKHELGRDFIESLARGLTVLTAFGAGRAALTLTDVARATGLTRATARRALITYQHLGLISQQPESRTFGLTPGSCPWASRPCPVRPCRASRHHTWRTWRRGSVSRRRWRSWCPRGRPPRSSTRHGRCPHGSWAWTSGWAPGCRPRRPPWAGSCCRTPGPGPTPCSTRSGRTGCAPSPSPSTTARAGWSPP